MPRDDAGLVLIHRPIVERPRGRELGARRLDRGVVGDDGQIGIASGQDDDLAIVPVGVLRRALGLGRRFPVLDVRPVEDLLRHGDARVGYTERPDNRRDAHAGECDVEAKRGQVDLLA